MQFPTPRIQDGSFQIATLKQGTKPITCILVSPIGPVLGLVLRVGRIADAMRHGHNWRGSGPSSHRPAAGRTTATRGSQIPGPQPGIFTDQPATRLVLLARPFRREKLIAETVQCIAHRDIALRNDSVHRMALMFLGASARCRAGASLAITHLSRTVNQCSIASFC